MISVTLGALDLPGLKPIRWTFKGGVLPSIHKYMISASQAASIDEEYDGSPIDFTFTFPEGEPEIIKHLYILEVAPGDHPDTRWLTVADRRWKWPYAHVYRTYNKRRKTSDVRLNMETGQPEEKAVLTGDVRFHAYSLFDKESVLWTDAEMFADVLDTVDPEAGYDIPFNIAHKLQIENLDLHDDGATAIARMLHFYPGYNIKVDREGLIVVYSEVDNSEAPVVAAARERIIVGSPWIGVVKKKYTRPRSVEVLFDREVELRFDFDETEAKTTTALREFTTLDNVMRVPDLRYDVTVDGQTNTYGRDSWVRLWSYLKAVEANEPVPQLADKHGIGPLSEDVLREHWASGFSIIRDAYTRGDFVNDPVWERRLNEVTGAFRHIFRLKKKSWDSMLDIKAYRAGIWDAETGTRAASDVYMNYTSVPTMKGLVKKSSEYMGALLAQPGVIAVGVNRTVVPGREFVHDNGWAADLKDAEITPYDVEILDSDNGIFGITPRLRWTGDRNKATPRGDSRRQYPRHDPPASRAPKSKPEAGSRT